MREMMLNLAELQREPHESKTVSMVEVLAGRAKDGERNAFEKLADMFWGDIFRMIYYRTGSRMDAEDLAQEVFLKAFRKLPGLKESGRFKPWLYSIALNLVRDFHRRKKVLSIFVLSSDAETSGPGPETGRAGEDALEELARREFWQKVRRFTRELPRAEREVFTLRFLDQLSIRETAEALEKNESSVKTHLYRAVAKFKRNQDLRRMLREEQ